MNKYLLFVFILCSAKAVSQDVKVIGKILDKATGKPIEHVMVVIWPVESIHATLPLKTYGFTDSLGAYCIPVTANRFYYVEFVAAGYGYKATRAKVPKPGHVFKIVDIPLAKGASPF